MNGIARPSICHFQGSRKQLGPRESTVIPSLQKNLPLGTRECIYSGPRFSRGDQMNVSKGAVQTFHWTSDTRCARKNSQVAGLGVIDDPDFYIGGPFGGHDLSGDLCPPTSFEGFPTNIHSHIEGLLSSIFEGLPLQIVQPT